MMFWIIVVAIIIWCISRGKTTVSSQHQSLVVKAKDEFVEQDAYLKNIEKIANGVSSEIQNAAAERRNLFEAKYRQDLERKEKLSKFAKTHHLDEILMAVWKEIRPYPNWSKRDDFSRLNKLNLKECVEIKRDYKDKTISFYWKDKKFEIVYKERSSCVPGDRNYGYADYVLFEEGQKSFGITVSISGNEIGLTYNTFSITAFKKQGEWCNFLLESWKAIKIGEEKRLAEFGCSDTDKIKSDFQD